MALQDEEQSSNKSGLIWIILLILSAIINIYQWRNHSTTITAFEQKVDTLVIERVNVEKELADTRTELNKYQGISANLDSLLKDANAKIDDQEKKIKSISARERNMSTLNKKLNEQLAELQALRDEYLGRVDSLMTANKQLQADKENLTTSLNTVSKNLETTVNTASMLKSASFKVNTYKRKGSGKYVESTLAKRTHKIQVSFDVIDNAIAKAGDRTVYLKITEPGGKVVGNRADGSNKFKNANGEDVLYTATQNIAYSGAKQNVIMKYEEQNSNMFPAGNYTIEVYIDGNLSGSLSYSMK
jgi:uncharacterized protein YeeX (DUF496 family)